MDQKGGSSRIHEEHDRESHGLRPTLSLSQPGPAIAKQTSHSNALNICIKLLQVKLL